MTRQIVAAFALAMPLMPLLAQQPVDRTQTATVQAINPAADQAEAGAASRVQSDVAANPQDEKGRRARQLSPYRGYYPVTTPWANNPIQPSWGR